MISLFQQSDAENAPFPFKESSTTLEQAFGLYEAAFCATAQVLPDVDCMRVSQPPSDGSANVFEKQDSTTQMDPATSAPPLKKSRRSPHMTPKLQAPHRRLSKSSPHKTPQSTVVQSEQSRQTRAQKRERSSSEEVLPQQHNAALCVC